MTILTCVTGIPDNPDYPVVEAISSDDVNQITIDGLRFISAGLGAINRVAVVFTDSSFLNAYDPTGPDAGLNVGIGNTIVLWTETQIIITNPNYAGLTVDEIIAEDYFANYFLNFDMPDTPIM